MKNTMKFIGVITLSVIIAFTMSTCDVGTTPKIDPCANGHTPGVAATCETSQTCTVCSQVITAATGHNWEWEEDAISASCTSASKDTASCLNENCAKTDERIGSYPALGHNLPGAKAATCIATGLTGIGHCNRCNQDLTGEVIPIDSSNHDFCEWAQKTAATCVAPERLIRVCSFNSAHTEEENNGEINTAAHDWNWTLNAIAATCVHTSKDTAACNNAPCTATNERDGSNPAFGHNWNWVITTPPNFTTETDGEETRTCSTCTTSDTRVYKFYKIGDTGPAGGVIFYIAPSGFTIQGYSGGTGAFDEYTAYYMEAAPADEVNSEWGLYGTLIADVTTFTSLSDSKASLIGNGRKDTLTIVNDTAFADLTGTAAQLCASKTVTVGGTVFNDWFLSSLGELNEMIKARTYLVGISSFDYFWSSSQCDNLIALVQAFTSGSQGREYKYNYRPVRAVRAF